MLKQVAVICHFFVSLSPDLDGLVGESLAVADHQLCTQLEHGQAAHLKDLAIVRIASTWSDEVRITRTSEAVKEATMVFPP